MLFFFIMGFDIKYIYIYMHRIDIKKTLVVYLLYGVQFQLRSFCAHVPVVYTSTHYFYRTLKLCY